MSVTADSFRQGFAKVFLDAAIYPDEAVQFWLGIAGLMLTTRWGSSSPTADVPPTSQIDWGTVLFAAHHLILEKQAGDAAARGATPGLTTGAISADSVGKVSRSYDTSAGLELEAGHWNLTIYGLRFIALAKMVGAGPITINGSFCGPGIGAHGRSRHRRSGFAVLEVCMASTRARQDHRAGRGHQGHAAVPGSDLVPRV